MLWVKMVPYVKMENYVKLFLIVIMFWISVSSDGKTPVNIIGNKEKDLTYISLVENVRHKRQSRNVSLVFVDSTNGNITKEFGDDVAFKCETRGSPTPNITWYRDNVTPVQRTLPVTYDKWSLLMKNLRSEDTGQYKCRVCYKDCVEREYNLNVKDTKSQIPTGGDLPEKLTVEIGESVTMSCPIFIDDKYATKWIKNVTDVNKKPNQIPEKSVGLSFLKGKYNVYDETLTIHNTTFQDQGWYSCNTTSKNESVVASVYLSIINGKKKQVQKSSKTKIKQWLIPTIATFSIIGLVALLIASAKIRYKKKKEALEMTSEMKTEEWKKIVSIERTKSNGYSADCCVQTPIVRIEKKRISEIKELNHLINASDYVMPIDANWEISRKDLNLGKILGQGEFGKVVQATLSNPTPCNVAVKMLKEGHSDADMVAFVSELEIMKIVGKHENIINLLGCCSQDGPLYVVVEYAQNGCLRDFLRKHKPGVKNGSTEETTQQLTQIELVEFALQVAKGMEYLASRGCLHRDLAARNVLVSAQRVLKVADFGLARDVRDADYYRKRTAGKLPIKWMAPESLAHNYYNTKSDVWSYGVLLWEVMSLGNTPYPQIPVHYLYQYLKMGKRMEMPENCRQDIYELMKHCCSFNPDDRPTFTEVKEKLLKIS